MAVSILFGQNVAHFTHAIFTGKFRGIVNSSVNFGRHFLFSLSLYLETKMLNSLSHILVI